MLENNEHGKNAYIGFHSGCNGQDGKCSMDGLYDGFDDDAKQAWIDAAMFAINGYHKQEKEPAPDHSWIEFE